MTDLLGLIGATLLSLCGVPQAVKSYRDGHSHGVSTGFLLMWLWGEVFLLTYVFIKYSNDWLLMLNYTVNLLTVFVIAFYKWWPISGH